MILSSMHTLAPRSSIRHGFECSSEASPLGSLRRYAKYVLTISKMQVPSIQDPYSNEGMRDAPRALDLMVSLLNQKSERENVNERETARSRESEREQENERKREPGRVTERERTKDSVKEGVKKSRERERAREERVEREKKRERERD